MAVILHDNRIELGKQASGILERILLPNIFGPAKFFPQSSRGLIII